MAEDWSVDVKKYVPDADDGIIAGIVRYCGIALQKRDSSLVSLSDKKETDRVRENFLKKKLGLVDSDADLDGAIAGVGAKMKADRTKNRVTVYYLLAEHFGKLAMFEKPAGKTAASKAPATSGEVGTAAAAIEKPATASGIGVTAAALGVAGAGAAVAGLGEGASAGAAPPTASTESTAGTAATSDARSADATLRPAAPLEGAGASAQRFAGQAAADADAAGSGGINWLAWLLLLAGILVLLWYLFMHRPAQAPQTAGADVSAPAVAPGAVSAPTDTTAAAAGTAPAAVAIPTGAGVTTETRDGKPVVNVYFDTGKTAVASAFGPAAASLKSYLDANAGSTLSVSGYNDKTGNAALNAELSKNRAKAVQAALVAANVPAASIALAKPADTTDAGTSDAQARRVEVVVK